MKRIRATGLLGVQVKAIDGACALHLVNAKGQKAEVWLPIAALEHAAAQARRGRLSLESRQAAGELQKAGTWEEFPMIDYRAVDVAAAPLLDPPGVVLIFDKDTETQLAYRVSAEKAKQLAQKLVDQSERSIQLSEGQTH